MPDPTPAPQEPAANPVDPANPNPTPDPAPTPTPDPANPVPPPANGKAWGDTWRQELAGEDPALLGQLERFTDPKALAASWRESQKVIRAGELLKPLPANATPEQLTQFRKDHGIPEKPEAYLENLPDGLVIGEDDKPIFDSFVKGLHEQNADPKIAQYAVAWYNKFQEEQAAKSAEADTAHRTEVEDTLRPEWGADYRANVNHVKAYLNGLGEAGEKIMNARDGSGRALLNDPNVMRALVKTARELNPSHTIVPGTGGNAPEAITEEIDKIEKVMRTNRTEYNRDEKMRSRLRDLYDAREKMKGRAA